MERAFSYLCLSLAIEPCVRMTAACYAVTRRSKTNPSITLFIKLRYVVEDTTPSVGSHLSHELP